ncbi:MAG: mechanosensitive ion channel [Gemmataceae bacterium]
MTAVIWKLLVCLLFQTPSTPATKADPPIKKEEAGPNQNVPPKTVLSDAEKITNAQESIQKAKRAIEKIQQQIDDPDGEYKKAEAEFTEINSRLKETKASIEKYRAEKNEAKAAEIEATLTKMQEEWQLSKDRFDIAIRQKKESIETIAAIKERMATDQALLDQLEGKPKPETVEPPAKSGQTPPTKPDKAAAGPSSPSTPSTPSTPPTTTTPPSHTGKPSSDPATKSESTATPKEESVGSLLSSSLLPGMPSLPTAPTTSPESTAESISSFSANDPEVAIVRDRLKTEKDELHDVEGRVRLADERVRAMERSIQSATKNLEIEQESIANEEKSIANLKSQTPQNEDEENVRAARLLEVEERLADSKKRVTRMTALIAKFNDSLAELKKELTVVTDEQNAKRAVVKASEAELASLLSPFAMRNLFQWFIRKGPHLGLILMGMLLLHLAARQFSRHFVRFITRNSNRGSPEDRENRTQTLVGVFRYASGLIVFGGGTVMLLDEVGVPVVPLMGGAAVLGLAVAFGAQNLIRDYFTGFMILTEDQYSVNDVVRIGSIAGLVEMITLRMTVLRDLEGIRHFIPHGTVTSVSNLTHGWSRALMEVQVAYKENVDEVINVLMQLGREMRQDPTHGMYILEDPEMLGVDGLADSGVVIKFLMKTRPLRQWPIKRELLRRIKNRFDEMGIEIPFPHRTVFNRCPAACRSKTC